MGYSCNRDAARSLDAILKLLQGEGYEGMQNAWIFDGREYFFERGREQEDGAVTGSVYRMDGGKVGGSRIEPDGTISRFPAMTSTQRREAKAAAIAYQEKVDAAMLAEHGPGVTL